MSDATKLDGQLFEVRRMSLLLRTLSRKAGDTDVGRFIQGLSGQMKRRAAYLARKRDRLTRAAKAKGEG